MQGGRGSPGDAAQPERGRRTLASLLMTLAATPLGLRGTRAAARPAEAAQGLSGVGALGIGAVSVLSCGAVGDGVHDDTEGFLRACAAAPLNGVVLVPRTRGSYRVRREIPLASRSLVGIGWPVIALDAANDATDLLRISVESGTYDRWHQGGTVGGLVLDGKGRGRDLIRVAGADSPQLRDLRLFGAGRDGLHVEGAARESWTESLNAMNVFISSSGRDNFHLAIPPELDFTFVNQTTFVNCKSRTPGRHALACVNGSREGGDNSKISELSWINGELDGTEARADDIVLLQSTGPGVVEWINFYDVAIEDGRAAHRGFAIRADARGRGTVGPVQTSGCIAYGAAGGLLNLDGVAGQGALDAADSNRVGTRRAGNQVTSGRTAPLERGQGDAISATAPGLLLKVFAAATQDGGPPRKQFGEWTVFGDAVVAVTEVGCTLAASNGRLMLGNAARSPSSLEWHVQAVG